MDKERYDGVALSLHWVMALLIGGGWVLALVLDELPKGPDRMALLGAHKTIGVAVLALVVVRLAWRSFNPPPAALEGSPAWARLAAAGGHLGLYALMFALPFSGVLMSQAGDHPVAVFGLFDLPTLVAPDKELSHTLHEVHEVLANLILALVGVHVAAALFHQHVWRDGTMARMLPGGTR